LNEESDLKKAGLKVTLPRLRILELLEEKKEMHLSAEDIYKKLLEAGEDVGLATVYRVLTQFEQAGIVVKNNFEEGRAVYELHHDQHHDHMVCVKTGKIIEFHDEIIEQRQSDVAKDLGYDIVDHSMVLYVEPIKK
jgi:Fur family ferric uptake transcriptional regulator